MHIFVRRWPFAFGGLELFEFHLIDLVGDDEEGFRGEEGFDGVEELALLLDGKSALLTEIEKVENAAVQMRERGTWHLCA